MPDVRERAIEWLRDKGAAQIDHPGGTLLAHLVRTESILREWGAPEAQRLAGLCHAAYGTDGFPVALLDLSERDVLRDLIGAEAEAHVYLYCACDRDVVYPHLGDDDPPAFRDRFTGETRAIGDAETRVLAEVTAANEFDLVVVNDWNKDPGMCALYAFIADARPRLSAPAWDAWAPVVAPGA